MHRERGYYPCRPRGQGHFPRGTTSRPSGQRLTPGAREVVSPAGIQGSFGKAAGRTLSKWAGLRRSESAVQRAAEGAGSRLGQRLRRGEAFGPPRPWQGNREGHGRTRAYVRGDATGILLQGPAGAEADGRMANGGTAYDPQPRPEDGEALSKPCDGARYLAGPYALDELGLQRRRRAGQVGSNAAGVWIALADGASGREEFMDGNFPRAVKILDFQHAAGHRGTLAKQSRQGPPAERLPAAWRPTLQRAGGKARIRARRRRDRKETSAALQAGQDELRNSPGNNVERAGYPPDRKQGGPIAPGAGESACEAVVNQRPGLGGLRWGEGGAESVAQLRALYGSDPDPGEAYGATAACCAYPQIWCLPVL